MSITLNRNRLALVDGFEPSQSLVAAAAKLSRSVGVLLADNGDDPSQQMHGTAISVDGKGLFITARHYVTDLNMRLVMNRVYQAKPVAVDDEKDLLLLEVTEPMIELVEPVTFAPRIPGPETEVLGLGHLVDGEGYKLGAYGARFLDRYSAVMDPANAASTPAEWLECALVFEGSHMNVPGFSGGPIITADGQVVALTSFGDGNLIITGPSSLAAAELVRWYQTR